MLADSGIACQVLNAVRHLEEARTIAQAGNTGSVTIATNMAGRGTDIRLGPGVRELGGLYVIAVEPQRSGRLDRQLHGRAGRQGDPGLETTFVSMEDELFVSLMPGPFRRLLALTLPRGVGRPSRLGRFVILLLQMRAERLAARRRLSILASDDWIDRNLSFTSSSAEPQR